MSNLLACATNATSQSELVVEHAESTGQSHLNIHVFVRYLSCDLVVSFLAEDSTFLGNLLIIFNAGNRRQQKIP